MKKLYAFMALILCLGVFGCFLGGSTCFAEEKIVVYGEGEIKFIPDLAIVTVGVESLNENLLEAQRQNSEAINAVIQTLLGFDVMKDQIKTKNFNVYQKFDYSDTTEKIVGYQVSNYIEFKTKAVDNISQIISKLMENGANRFSGVSFTLENYSNAYNSALKLALENAKSKAKALCDDELELVEIVEQNYSNSFMNDAYVYAKVANENMAIMKGEIVVKATIKAMFEFDD